MVAQKRLCQQNYRNLLKGHIEVSLRVDAHLVIPRTLHSSQHEVNTSLVLQACPALQLKDHKPAVPVLFSCYIGSACGPSKAPAWSFLCLNSTARYRCSKMNAAYATQWAAKCIQQRLHKTFGPQVSEELASKQ